MAEPIISRLLPPEHIVLGLAGLNREEVIPQLVAVARPFAGRETERLAFVNALLEREHLHSTGTGEGVAFPHARNAQGTVLAEPLLIFGRHPRGVNFHAIDNKPVHLFFLMSAPNMTQHLQLLATLSRVMRVAKVREELMSAATTSKIIELLDAAERKLAR